MTTPRCRAASPCFYATGQMPALQLGKDAECPPRRDSDNDGDDGDDGNHPVSHH